MLCGDHPAAIIDCSLCQRVSRIKSRLRFHIDNKTYHIFLCSRTFWRWCDCIEPDIIIDGSFRQRRILIIASDNYVRSFLGSVCIINIGRRFGKQVWLKISSGWKKTHTYPCRRSCLFLLDTKTFWQACNLHYPRFGLGSREVARKRCIQVHSWRRKECREICRWNHCSKQRRSEILHG